MIRNDIIDSVIELMPLGLAFYTEKQKIETKKLNHKRKKIESNRTERN